MTTTTDTLTRWLPLYEQDESLRPEGTYVTYNSDGQPFLMYGTKKGGGMGLGPIADMAIRDTAVQWLLDRNDGDSYVKLSSNSGWSSMPPFRVRTIRNTNGLGDTLDDALYAACKAVLAGNKT